MVLRSLFVLICGLAFSGAATAQPPQVVTSIKPLQLIAAAVLANVASPALLLPPGASPHNYALRPSDRRALLQAQRIYWVGGEMERFLSQLLTDQPQATAVATLDGVKLRLLQQNHATQDEPAIHHAHDHDHDHAPGTIDGHIWLDPDNARAIARFIAADITQLDPQQAAQIASNLASFEQRLSELDQRLTVRLAPLRNKPWFVFHDALGYFEDHYAIHSSGVFTLSADVQPGARHLHELRNQLSSSGPSCVFREPQFSPRLINSLGQGLDVRVSTLDPLGSDIEPDARGYETLLANVGDTLADCLEQL